MGLFSGIGGFIGGLFGNKAAKGDINRMRDYYNQGLESFKKTNVESGPSAMADVKTNPAARAAQMQALGALQGEAAAGGLTAEDRAAQQQAQEAAAQQARGQQEAILQGAAARGGGGSTSGNTLAAQLAAQQGSAQRGAMVGTQQAADARRRALSAMAGAGELGGKIEGQQFGEQAAQAQAADAIARFNAGQRLQKAAGLTGAYQKTADMYGGEAQRKKQEATSMGSGIGGLGDSLLGTFL